MTTKAQLAQYCADHFPHTLHSGTTFMHATIAAVVALAVGFGIGWYVKGRGLTGVKTDLTNAKTAVTTDVTTLEGKLSAPAVTA